MANNNSSNRYKSGNRKEGQSFRVSENALLMEFLIVQMPHKSRNNIKSLLSHKQVLVDGEPVSRFDHPLKPGQKVEIGKIRVAQEQKFKEYTVVYEDPYFIAIDKAAGLLVTAPEKTRKLSAFGLLKRHLERKSENAGLFVVMGLDRETSGLMLFAKSPGIRERLLENHAQNEPGQTYVALVEGSLDEKQGTIANYLWEDKAFRMHSSENPSKGNRAVTHYSVIKKNQHHSLLHIHAETRVKNQIRVHMQESGHPIVGDRKYGAADNSVKRLALHSMQLTFTHPVSGRKIKLESKTPRSFMRLVQE